jgi:hypothetical protein
VTTRVTRKDGGERAAGPPGRGGAGTRGPRRRSPGRWSNT